MITVYLTRPWKSCGKNSESYAKRTTFVRPSRRRAPRALVLAGLPMLLGGFLNCGLFRAVLASSVAFAISRCHYRIGLGIQVDGCRVCEAARRGPCASGARGNIKLCQCSRWGRGRTSPDGPPRSAPVCPRHSLRRKMRNSDLALASASHTVRGWPTHPPTSCARTDLHLPSKQIYTSQR